VFYTNVSDDDEWWAQKRGLVQPPHISYSQREKGCSFELFVDIVG
jgi:hypothetical protein